MGRFINADLEIGSTFIGNNMYQYSFNNPINYRDDNGNWSQQWSKRLFKIGIGIAAFSAGVIITVATGGAAGAAIIGGLQAMAISSLVSGGISAGFSLVESVIRGDDAKTTASNVWNGFLDGASEGIMAGGIYSFAGQVMSAGFKTAGQLGTNTGNESGIYINDSIKILSPDKPWQNNNGGTLFKYTAANFHMDVSSKYLFHYHMIPRTALDIVKAYNKHRHILFKVTIGIISGIETALDNIFNR